MTNVLKGLLKSLTLHVSNSKHGDWISATYCLNLLPFWFCRKHASVEKCAHTFHLSFIAGLKISSGRCQTTSEVHVQAFVRGSHRLINLLQTDQVSVRFYITLRSMQSPPPPTTVIITLNGLSWQKTVNRGFWVDLWQAQLGSGLQADWLLWRQRPCSTLIADSIAQISRVLIIDYCPEMCCASLVPLCDGPCSPNVFGWSPRVHLKFSPSTLPKNCRTVVENWKAEMTCA